LRDEADVTQEKAAWDSDFAKSHLSQVEAGLGFPSVPALFALAKRLGIDALDFLAVEKDSPKTKLIDALRKKDLAEIRAALEALGIWESLTSPAPEPDKKPAKPKRTG
jgi:transcriptional regulator with XRE-family HTH domain